MNLTIEFPFEVYFVKQAADRFIYLLNDRNNFLLLSYFS